jgi:hypothetical protein
VILSRCSEQRIWHIRDSVDCTIWFDWAVQ